MGARKEIEGTEMGVRFGVVDGVVLATSPPLPASSCRGERIEVCARLSVRL